MKKISILLCVAFASIQLVIAQENNDNKDLWATSFLNKKAPELKIEKWLSEEPELEGKFILLEFWATWCGPCRKAIPKLNAWHKKFADDLVVIGLSEEKEATVRDMISPVIEYYNAIDTRTITKRAINVQGIPHAILMTPEGIVIWEGFPLLAGSELTDEKIAALIKKYKK